MKIPKFAEIKFFHLMLEHYRGLQAFSKFLNVGYFELNNWIHRGYVPKEEVLRISKILNISPLILNNKQFHYISNWKELIEDVKFLTAKEILAIKKLPLKYK